MTTAQARARADRPSVGWLIGTSLWLVFVLLPNGVTTWVGFAIIGFAVVRPAWIIASVGYFIASIVISSASDDIGVWSSILGGVLWVLGIAHGIAANRRWQTTLWSRTERGVRLLGRGTTAQPGATARRAGRSVPTEAVGLLDATGTDRSDYLDDTPTPDAGRVTTRPATTRTSGRRSPSNARAAELPTAAVDVNTATQKELQSLPAFTRQRAKGAIRERERLGGFSSVDQFATVVGLQPHELARLTPVLECSPKPRKPRSFGRRVDL